ncbi:histidine phosphatase family protein [Fructilactobacillus florum]|uniref:Phosphoglycerate mutase n=1 Tax=Fructilactobacillus florum DSM 22689 = JCM 16035 TaxID=1423745 RepID=A0A0R2CQR2_9LACO|nr:histidine phosphatase family protein [Fructilactobacillus florum]KRM90524.1 hypothetical protein FC87_GL001209 [Fructilactobacillus florum DSM 22689 = JCM 16035]
MATTNLYFVRHGQTQLNRYHRLQGWADSDLTSQGIADANQAGLELAQINFTQAFSSDTIRAQHTANLILAANQVSSITVAEPQAALREENFGFFEGNDAGQTWNIIGGPHNAVTYGELIRQFSIEKTRDMIAAADPYGDAETDQQFWDRLQPILDHISEHAPANSNILVASHGTLIRSLVSKYSDHDITAPIRNGSLTKITVTDRQYQVAWYNQSSLPTD